MKHSVIENLIGLILMVSAVSGIAGQQTLTGALTGSVLDQVGAVVPGANVTLTLKEGTKGGAARKSATNNEGKFSFLDLPFGEYEIKIWTIWTNKEFRRSVKNRFDETGTVQHKYFVRAVLR